MKKFIFLISILFYSHCLLSAVNYPITSASASSQLWPVANVYDGNNTSVWSSNTNNASNNTESVSITINGSQNVNLIKLFPRYYNSLALGFPVDFNIYYWDNNGSNWVLAQSYTSFPTPNRNDSIILPLSTTVNTNAILISAGKLGLDDLGNYVFQMGEFGLAYDHEFECNFHFLGNTFVNSGGNVASNENEIRNVGSDGFDPNKFSNWNFEYRKPFIAANSGGNSNIYAPTLVKNGGAWNVFFGGWDGTTDFHDRISLTVTGDDFLTFGSHALVINSGIMDHVNNGSALKTGVNQWWLYYTTLPTGSGAKNKPCYATSANGLNFTPNAGNSNYSLTMTGYSPWANADVNGSNVMLNKNGTYHLYFDNFTTNLDGVHYAISTDGINFTYQNAALTENGRVCNDVKEFTFNNQNYYVMMAHANTSAVFYSVSNNLSSFPTTQTLTNNFNSNDQYITAVGIASDNNRCLGLLYGAGAVPTLDHNAIYAKWLQKKVIFSNQYIYWGIGESGYGPDRIRLYMDNTVETGKFLVYDTDGQTLLYKSPSVTMRGGDIWEYFEGTTIPTIIPSGATTFCQGGSVILDAGSGYSNYLWSNGITTQTNTITNSGNYSVIVTSGNLCSANSSVTAVTVNSNPSTPNINASGPTSFCQGNNVILDAGTGYTNYLWSDGVVTQTNTITSSGNYSVIVTNGSGCSATSSITTVTVHPPPNVACTPPSSSFCVGDSVQLTATGANSYYWTPSTGLSASAGNAVTASPIVTTTYTIIGVVALGCTNTTSITVVVNPLPTVTCTPASPAICIGDSVNLTANGASIYTWMPSTGLSTSTGSNVIATPIVTSTYILKGISSLGCTDTIAVTITINPLPPIPIITQSGSNLASSVVSGNQWYLNNSIIIGATSQNYPPTQSGNYSLVVIDSNGCSASSVVFNYTITSMDVSNRSGSEIVIYPNPNDGKFKISFGQSELVFVSRILKQGCLAEARVQHDIFIYNMLGEKVFQSSSLNRQTSNEIDLSASPKGIYFVKIYDGYENHSEKIIVQ